MFGILGLGFLLGMQHALEADHIAAVSSIAARRSHVADIVKHGLTWGLGHTLTLFVFAGCAILLGRAVVVWTQSGPQRGVIGRKATHLMTDEDRKKTPKLTDLWIDLGAVSAEEVKKTVRVGDPVTVELGARDLPNGRISGPKLDNTAGLFVVLETLKRLAGKTFDPALFVVSAVCGAGFIVGLPLIGPVAGAVGAVTWLYGVCDGYIQGRKKH